MSPLKFSLKSNVVPVTLDAGDGSARDLEMREMSASARDRYLDCLSSRMRYDGDGKPAGIKKFDGMQAELLSLCLFAPDGKRVTEGDIQLWPASVVSDLYKAAQEMNHLSAGAVVEPPKD